MKKQHVNVWTIWHTNNWDNTTLNAIISTWASPQTIWKIYDTYQEQGIILTEEIKRILESIVSFSSEERKQSQIFKRNMDFLKTTILLSQQPWDVTKKYNDREQEYTEYIQEYINCIQWFTLEQFNYFKQNIDKFIP